MFVFAQCTFSNSVCFVRVLFRGFPLTDNIQSLMLTTHCQPLRTVASLVLLFPIFPSINNFNLALLYNSPSQPTFLFLVFFFPLLRIFFFRLFLHFFLLIYF